MTDCDDLITCQCKWDEVAEWNLNQKPGYHELRKSFTLFKTAQSFSCMEELNGKVSQVNIWHYHKLLTNCCHL